MNTKSSYVLSDTLAEYLGQDGLLAHNATSVINDLVTMRQSWGAPTPSTFSTIEITLVSLHDNNLLTLAVLDAVGETWRGYEILPVVDEDGSGNTVMTNDGLYLSDVALGLIEPGFSPESHGHSWQRFDEVAKDRYGWL